MRCALFACSLSLAVACTPAGGPGPESGGQTGDPGVADFTSIDVDEGGGMPGGPGGGSCRRAVGVLEHGEPVVPQSTQVRLIDDAHLALLDPRRGLVIVETSGSAPRTVGTLPMAPLAGTLHISGRLAFLSRRNLRPWLSYFANGYPEIDDDAALVAIDLSDLSAPRIIATSPLPRAPRMSALVSSAAGTRLYVLSDGGAANGCASFDEQRWLMSYEWREGSFAPRAELELASDPLEVEVLGERLVLRGPSELRFVALTAADGAMRESTALPAPEGSYAGLIHAESEQVWRVVASVSRDDPSLRISTYDVSNPDAITRRSDCTIGRAGAGGGIASPAFSPRHTIFVDARGINGPYGITTVRHEPDGTCVVQRLAGQRRQVVNADHAVPGRLIELDVDERGTVARLLDDADLRVIGEVIVPSVTVSLGGLQVKRTSGSEPAGVVGAATFAPGPPEQRALQLFTFTANGIHAAGTVTEATRLEAAATRETLAWAGDTWRPGALMRLDLADPAQPKASAALDPLPGYTYLFSLARHWLRVRGVAGISSDDEISDEELFAPRQRAHIEVVPIDRDPERGAAVANVEVNPRARILQLGARLVAITSHNEAGARAQLEVFDLEDPEQPVRSAELSSELFALPDPCVTCRGEGAEELLLTLPNALVRFARANDAPSLRVLDVSDASDPRETTVTLPGTGLFLAAFAHGSSVYYSYREPSQDTPTRNARFYFRRIELAQPSSPELGEAVNVPGQLLATDGENLYTREVAQAENSSRYERRIHRLVLRERGAVVQATHVLGERVATALTLDQAGHLLVDLQGLAPEPRAPDLRVLDAESLAQLGERRLWPYTRLLSVRGDRALYVAAEGLALIDLREPGTPALATYVPLVMPLDGWFLRPTSTSTLLTDAALVYADGGAIQRVIVSGDKRARAD